MQWRLVVLLSLCGMAMGVLTVSWIPSSIEPLCWLAIFGGCAVIIAKQCERLQFFHGLCVGLLNCVWMTFAHYYWFDRYIAVHAKVASMLATMPLPNEPRLMMALLGPVAGVVFGIVLGLLALAVSRWIKPRSASAL